MIIERLFDLEENEYVVLNQDGDEKVIQWMFVCLISKGCGARVKRSISILEGWWARVKRRKIWDLVKGLTVEFLALNETTKVTPQYQMDSWVSSIL